MGRLNLDAVRQAKAKLESQGSGGAAFAKLQQGKNIVRILFPKGDSENFYAEGSVHFGVGEEGKNMVTCPKTFGEHNRCPICEYVDQLRKSKDKNDKALAERIGRRKRVYINVIDRDDDSDEDEPKVLPIGITILKALLDTMCDPDYGDITNPKEGRDVTITKKGQGLKTEYSVLPKPVTSPASKTISEEELEDKMADLNALFKEQSYDELAEMLQSGEDSDDDTAETSGSDATSTNEDDYDAMELDELRQLCEDRGIDLPEKASKLKLIMLLTQYDEQQEDSDEVLGKIGEAISSRKNK